MVLSFFFYLFFFGKVQGEAHSTPALLELTVPGWEMAEWKTAQPALQGLSAPGEPPSQFFAQCKYTTHAVIAVGLCAHKKSCM